MTDREPHLREVPKGKPWNLPGKTPEKVLNDAGFPSTDWSRLEAAGIYIDFEPFRRNAVPASSQNIFRPQLDDTQVSMLANTKPELARAVSDAAITDEAISGAGRRAVSELHAANINDQLVQRISERAFAIYHCEKLQNCPVATLTAAFLLMGNEAFRTVGANIALSIPPNVARAFTELDERRRSLPGSAVFSQMLYRGSVRDKEDLYAAARERSNAFFDTIIGVIDAIDDPSLLAFDEMSKVAAGRFKKITGEHRILAPLEDCERNFRAAMIKYAKYIEHGKSNLGTITESSDGSYEAIGLDELKGVYESLDKFLGNDYFKSFFQHVRDVHHLPGISAEIAGRMSTTVPSRSRMTLKELRVQSDFQTSITHEILNLFRKIERYYSAKAIRSQHGTRERIAISTKLAIARGMVIELLMINEFFMNTVEKKNNVFRMLIGEFEKEPEEIVTHPKNTANLQLFAHIALENAARLSHARKTALTLLKGVFGN